MGIEPDADIDRLLEGWIHEHAAQLNAAIADAEENGIFTMLSLELRGSSDFVRVAVGRMMDARARRYGTLLADDAGSQKTDQARVVSPEPAKPVVGGEAEGDG